MMAITHGDLLACACGQGKPNLSHLMKLCLFEVSCDACGLCVLNYSETAAVADWNVSMRAMMARAVA